MFRDQPSDSRASSPSRIDGRCERNCCRCCLTLCSSPGSLFRIWFGLEPRYVPAFQDNRPDSSSFSASRYQAPSAPSRDISATGQGTSSGGAEGSALLGKGQTSSTELQDTGSANRSPVAEGPNQDGTRLNRRVQSAEHIAKLVESKASGGSPRVPKLGSGLTLAPDDEDACPTCLEPYSDENPKILTQCQHHFHLACIYEWLERSQTCPICSRQMSFDEFGQQ